MNEELEPELALTSEEPGRLRRNPLGKVTVPQKYREFEKNRSAEAAELDRAVDPAICQFFNEEKLALHPGPPGPGLAA